MSLEKLMSRSWKGTPRVAWLGALVALSLAAGCSDDKNPAAPSTTNTVGSVTLVASSTSLPVQGGEVEITVTVSTTGGTRLANQSVTFTASKGTLSPATATTDASGQAKVKLTTTETATVKATVSGVASSDLSISVRGPVTISTTLNPAEPQAGQVVTITVVAKRGDADVTGALFLNYGNGEGLEAGTINGTRQIQYTYKNEGSFNLTSAVREADSSETRHTVRVTVRQAPGLVNPGTGGDDINAKDVNWFADCDVSDWPIEEKVISVDIGANEICVDYTGRGTKATFDIGIPVDGTLWVFAQFGGRWYGATWDHLRPGAFCKAESAESLGSDQIRVPPMDASWVPRRGDKIGFMVSGGLARRECAPERNTRWRTNISLITWP